ncbi:hypothetical protein W03_13560 [Nitrosomonas sp. PY1]|nr:hypothetical protein W03_13560 [Nitrosomonas sp. PY1]
MPLDLDILDDPAVKCGVVKSDTALSHDFLQVPVRHAVAEDIKLNGIENDSFRVMATFESEHDRWR